MDRVDPDQTFAAALALHQSGRLQQAEQAYRAILQQHPDHADSLHLLGVIGLQTGQLDGALTLIRHAVELRPDGAAYRSNLGVVLERLGRFDEAVAEFEAAIRLDPAFAEACNNLGQLCERLNRVADAEAHYRRAIAINADYAEPHNNLGNLLKDRGELDAAIACYRRAIALRPDYAHFHSNLLLTLHYHADYSSADLAREHAEWAKRHVAPLVALRKPHANDPDPGRRIRIGYVSPDFREHAVARFMLPLLSNHDRDRFELFAYSDTLRPDSVTEALREFTDQWLDVSSATDEMLADRIRSDRIDILVDLASHSGRNRLQVFARKPAPVQLSYLAYCSTTGVDAIDYRLTDRCLDPPGADLSWYTEKSIRLPGCYWCYLPPESGAESAPPTEREPGPPTFGCLNNFAKVTPVTLDLWGALLNRVPDAHLLLYAREENQRARVRDVLGRKGVAASRLGFVGWQTIDSYLDTYRRIDVALDPYPYTGGTTTCDALWMGVPVVTRTGRTAVSRAGSSLLSHAGLDRFVASTPEEYLDIAAALIERPGELAELRETLRPQLAASPVMDHVAFARNLEAVFRDIWQRWCSRTAGAG